MEGKKILNVEKNEEVNGCIKYKSYCVLFMDIVGNYRPMNSFNLNNLIYKYDEKYL